MSFEPAAGPTLVLRLRAPSRPGPVRATPAGRSRQRGRSQGLIHRFPPSAPTAPAEGVESLLDIRRSLLHLPSLPRTVRILVVLGMAQVLAGLLGLLLRDAPVAGWTVGTFGGDVLTMPWPVLLVGALLLCSGWTYLLAGALRGPWWVALGCLALATAAQGDLLAGGRWVARLALVLVWAYCLGRRWLLRRAALLVDVAALGGLLALVQLGPLAQGLLSDDGAVLAIYPAAVSTQATTLMALLIPMLVLAGVDLAELALRGGAWGATYGSGQVPERAAAGLLLLVAGVRLAVQLRRGTPLPGIAAALVVVLVAVALLSRLPRHGGGPPRPPAFGALFVLSYTFFGADILGQLLPGSLLFGAAAQQAALRVPEDAVWALLGIAVDGGALLAILAARLRQRPPPATTLFLAIWGCWVLLTIGNPAAFFAGGQPTETVLTLSRVDAALSLCAAAALAFMLSVRRINRGALVLVGTVLLTFTLLAGVDSAEQRSLALGDLLLFSQVGLLLAIPAFALLGLARGPGSGAGLRVAATVSGAILALLCLGGAFLLAGATLGVIPPGWRAVASRSGEIGQVALLGTALIWDLLISGRRFTNQDGRRFPREGRVLLYLGYIVLAAAALLWLKTLRGSGRDAFEPQSLVDFGLIVLGLPLVFYSWAVIGRRALTQRA